MILLCKPRRKLLEFVRAEIDLLGTNMCFEFGGLLICNLIAPILLMKQKMQIQITEIIAEGTNDILH